MAELLLIKNGKTVKKFPLEAINFIGRIEECNIRINDSKISRRHAKLEIKDNNAIIYDLNSKNGIEVNDELISEVSLYNGDEILIGDTILLFRDVAESEYDSNVILTPKYDSDDTYQVHSVIEHSESYILSTDLLASDHKSLIRAHKHLSALYKIGNTLRATLDLSELLRQLMEQIFAILSADRGIILLKDENTDELFCAHLKKIDSDNKLRTNNGMIEISKTIVNRVMGKKEGLLTVNAQLDERFATSQSIMEQNIISALCVPLISQEEVLGVIYIDTTFEHGAFTDDDLELLTAIGNQSGILLGNLRMYKSVLEKKRLESELNIAKKYRENYSLKNCLKSKVGNSLLKIYKPKK